MKLRRRWTKGWRQDLLRMLAYMATIPLLIPSATLRAAEPHNSIAMAQKANADAYATFSVEYRNLNVAMTSVRIEIETNENERLEFVAVSEEHSLLLNHLYEEAPKLTEAFRRLAEEYKEVEIYAFEVRRGSDGNVTLSMQVACAAAMLPANVKRAIVSALIGQVLALVAGIAIGGAMAGGASATTTTTKGGGFIGGGGGGSPSAWGIGSPSAWGGIPGGGGGGGWLAGGFFSKSVTTVASGGSSLWGLAAAPLLAAGAVAGGQQAPCVGPGCVPAVATPCVKCVQSAPCRICEDRVKECDGTPECIERMRKECKECTECQQKKSCTECDDAEKKAKSFCPDCKFQQQDGASPSSPTPTLVPIPESFTGAFR